MAMYEADAAGSDVGSDSRLKATPRKIIGEISSNAHFSKKKICDCAAVMFGHCAGIKITAIKTIASTRNAFSPCASTMSKYSLVAASAMMPKTTNKSHGGALKISNITSGMSTTAVRTRFIVHSSPWKTATLPVRVYTANLIIEGEREPEDLGQGVPLPLL